MRMYVTAVDSVTKQCQQERVSSLAMYWYNVHPYIWTCTRAYATTEKNWPGDEINRSLKANSLKIAKTTLN